MTNHESNTFNHLLAKARAAQRGGKRSWAVQSTGERCAVALLLTKTSWLRSMDYTVLEALQRLDYDWRALLPAVAQALREEF